MRMKSDPYQTLLSSAFRYVSIRSRSEKELKTFLLQKAKIKKIEEKFVGEVFERMRELGYIDDKKFAESLLLSQTAGKPKGPRVIKQALKQKGISDEIVETVFLDSSHLFTEESSYLLAQKALGKKGEQYKKLDPISCQRKVHDFLFRRGFSSSIIRRLVDDFCQKAYNKGQENSV
jgi:regulatory protein